VQGSRAPLQSGEPLLRALPLGPEPLLLGPRALGAATQRQRRRELNDRGQRQERAGEQPRAQRRASSR
jgi:hypothetical protein